MFLMTSRIRIFSGFKRRADFRRRPQWVRTAASRKRRWVLYRKPLWSDDHDVERQRSEAKFATLGVLVSGPEGGAEESFDHAVDGFDLPPLPTARTREVVHHAPTPVAFRLLGALPADPVRDERVDAEIFAGVLVHVFGVVPGVGQQGDDRLTAEGVVPRDGNAGCRRRGRGPARSRESGGSGNRRARRPWGIAETSYPRVFSGLFRGGGRSSD